MERVYSYNPGACTGLVSVGDVMWCDNLKKSELKFIIFGKQYHEASETHAQFPTPPYSVATSDVVWDRRS